MENILVKVFEPQAQKAWAKSLGQKLGPKAWAKSLKKAWIRSHTQHQTLILQEKRKQPLHIK